ncbi:MAG: hypothetical protein GF384_07850, partial [Elusimicrobia bacterium]|nr:hypothetical protein [Elusimicrobiota bacterium]
ALRYSLNALKKHGILATAVDINFFEGGIQIPFFGKQKTVPTGPALVSYHTNTPIINSFVILDTKQLKYRILTDDPIYPNQKAPQEEEIERITKTVVGNIEKNIRAFPDQWFIFQEF